MPSKLLLVPDADGYTESEAEEVIRVELDGGAGRYRLDKIGATKKVNVRWTMNPSQYQYWRAFYATATQNGALSFLCDLVSEDGCGPTEYVCNFIPGSVSKPAQSGLTYIQAATLEVIPNTRNEEFDLTLLALYESAGGEPEFLMLSVHHFINIAAPVYIHE